MREQSAEVQRAGAVALLEPPKDASPTVDMSACEDDGVVAGIFADDAVVFDKKSNRRGQRCEIGVPIWKRIGVCRQARYYLVYHDGLEQEVAGEHGQVDMCQQG